jgi:hypothetical protein
MNEKQSRERRANATVGAGAASHHALLPSSRPRRGRPPKRSVQDKVEEVVRENHRRRVAGAEGRPWPGQVKTFTDAELRTLRRGIREQNARAAARLMKAAGKANRQIAESDLMVRILGRKVSPSRISRIASGPAPGQPWRAVEEFQEAYAKISVAIGSELAARLWRELVYRRLEGILAMADGEYGDKVKVVDRQWSPRRPGEPGWPGEPVVRCEAIGSELPPLVTNTVAAHVRKLRDDLVCRLFSEKRWKDGRPVVASEGNAAVRAAAKAFGLSQRQIVGIVRPGKRERRTRAEQLNDRRRGPPLAP